MPARGAWNPQSARLLQLAGTLLVALYLLFIGGAFDATVRFRVQLLNYVAGSGLALVWLALRWTRRQSWQASGLELPLLLLAGTQWVAVLTSAQPRLSLEWAAGIVTWSAALCILYDLLATGWPRAYVTNALLLVAALLSADGLWAAANWYAHWIGLGQWPPVTFRFDGMLGHSNLTAGVLNLLLPLVIVRAASGGARVRLAGGALAAAMIITEFFTSSRGGWLAAGLSFATFGGLLLYRRGGLDWLRGTLTWWRGQSWALKTVSVLGVFLAAGGAAWLLSRQAQHITHASLFDSRQPFWSAAWELFKSQPLTGAGPDLYPWFYSRFASIPPDFFAPHAHSLVFQILSGSGLFGFAGLLVVGLGAGGLLWRAWLAAGRSLELAALMVGLLSVAVHQLFDYLFGTPILLFLVVVVLALALAPVPGARPRFTRPLLWAVPALLVPIVVFGFALRAARWNDIGLTAAAHNQWRAAATAFEAAVQSDPGLPLYSEEAAYSETRAGRTEVALPLWEQAIRADPYWAVLPASIGAIQPDPVAAQTARVLAPRSYLFALNAGAIAEAQGNAGLATEAYTTALSLNPAIADALYWQQNPRRAAILVAWRASRPPDNSALAVGWQLLSANAPAAALVQFQAARARSPDSLAPYAGLARAYLQLLDLAAAQQTLDTGLAWPFTKLEETLGLHLAAGDLRDARGDRAGATAEYALVFSAISDYNIDGPGSLGDTGREWQVFHRETLPGELIPQLPRADITADMDQRFAKLAQWYRDQGRPDLACLVLARVQREAPVSVSGDLFRQQCPAS